ncbi:hypothetical protein C942_02870 [Photobacterium marinum]|uniref:Uncharacterized protein n=1 Tax=Photobacterium marinum TaxID=1056511 RepID=L8J804_9GAMM|nr:hypothetical protein C942_02870 [Photobacterium marinum]
MCCPVGLNTPNGVLLNQSIADHCQRRYGLCRSQIDVGFGGKSDSGFLVYQGIQ